MAEQLRQQLTIGAPSNADEQALRQLADPTSCQESRRQALPPPSAAREALPAVSANDPINPIVGYLGSSNLTFAGLSGQGELNVDVLDHDAALKLKKLVRGQVERPVLRGHH